MTQEMQASPEMQKFFERLLQVKSNLKALGDQISEMAVEMHNINEELNEIIKETK